MAMVGAAGETSRLRGGAAAAAAASCSARLGDGGRSGEVVVGAEEGFVGGLVEGAPAAAGLLRDLKANFLAGWREARVFCSFSDRALMAWRRLFSGVGRQHG
jgi:hypothetical protein